MQLRLGPPQLLVQEPERVFRIEAPQVHGPPMSNLGHVLRDRVGHPRPHSFRGSPTGLVLDVNPDHGAFQDHRTTRLTSDPAPGIKFGVHPLERLNMHVPIPV